MKGFTAAAAASLLINRSTTNTHSWIKQTTTTPPHRATRYRQLMTRGEAIGVGARSTMTGATHLLAPLSGNACNFSPETTTADWSHVASSECVARPRRSCTSEFRRGAGSSHDRGLFGVRSFIASISCSLAMELETRPPERNTSGLQ